MAGGSLTVVDRVEAVRRPRSSVEQPQRRGDVGHLDHLHAVDRRSLRVAARARSPGSAGHHGHRKPSRAASASRCGQVADPAQLAGQADLAHRHHAGGRRAAERGRGQRDRDRQVAGRLGQPGAADGRGEDVVVVQPDAAVLLEHGEHHRHPGGVEPGRRTPRPLGGGGVTSACTSASSGRRPSMVTATQVPGDLLVVVLDEQAGRVGDRGDAVGGEVEAADLVDRAEAVLHRPDHPEPGVAVALEVEHHVDEVLEHPRAGDRAVLGDVADEHGGDVAGLGDPDQRGGDLLDLGDAAGHAVDARRRRWSGSSRRPAASGRTCSMWVSTAPRSVSAAR